MAAVALSSLASLMHCPQWSEGEPGGTCFTLAVPGDQDLDLRFLKLVASTWDRIQRYWDRWMRICEQAWWAIVLALVTVAVVGFGGVRASEFARWWRDWPGSRWGYGSFAFG